MNIIIAVKNPNKIEKKLAICINLDCNWSDFLITIPYIKAGNIAKPAPNIINCKEKIASHDLYIP